MADLSLVTDNMLPVSSETYASTLSAGISAGAATVPAFSTTAYAEGDDVVLTVDPGTASQATFLGEKQGNSFINCKWTEGNVGASHSSGATIIDYDSSTHYNAVTKAIRVHANSDGTLKTTAVQAALNIPTTSIDWQPLSIVPTVVSNNGQKEHVIRYTGVNYTDRINEGMKLRIPRTGTTPTTSMAFVAASSQYASKASPTGFTFTDDFTIEDWVYLDSYTGAIQSLKSRTDGTNGFLFYLQPSGTVRLAGYNGALTNNRAIESYQSIPLNKWTHVAATLDMSGFTTATCKVYIDGVDVPAFIQQSGTNPTALIQAGNLQIGAYNGANGLLNGKTANGRIWSTLRTATEIRNNMNQETPASTTGLVAHFKGNGSWNDSSANANHLTASGGAVNNFASHPFSAVEWAIPTKSVYTGGNTDVTIFMGSGCLPNETLGATSYSTARAPYGFPAARGLWRVSSSIRGDNTTSSNGSYGSYINGGWKLRVPTGAFTVGWRAGSIYNNTVNPVFFAVSGASLTGMTQQQAASIGALIQRVQSPSAAYLVVSVGTEAPQVVTVATDYTMYTYGAVATAGIDGSTALAEIYAECAYL